MYEGICETMTKANTTEISDLEANALLFGFDKEFGVNEDGLVTTAKYGYTIEDLQRLRDKLFDVHEHPESED